MYQALLYLKTNLPVCLFTHSKGIKIGPSYPELGWVSKLSLAMNNPVVWKQFNLNLFNLEFKLAVQYGQPRVYAFQSQFSNPETAAAAPRRCLRSNAMTGMSCSCLGSRMTDSHTPGACILFYCVYLQSDDKYRAGL